VHNGGGVWFKSFLLLIFGGILCTEVLLVTVAGNVDVVTGILEIVASWWLELDVFRSCLFIPVNFPGKD